MKYEFTTQSIFYNNAFTEMKKSKLMELDNEQLERVVSMAQEERKPFEVINVGVGHVVHGLALRGRRQ